MNIIKNILLVLLSIVLILFWLQGDEEEYDPDSVTIEYRCSVLEEYKNVPPEVSEECKDRNDEEETVDKKTSV